MRFTKKVGKASALLVALVVSYFLAMLLAYSFPNSMIENNVDQSLATLQSELVDIRVTHSFGLASQLDNHTDREMINTSLKSDEVSLIQAAVVEEYSRYWHGYQVLLRPALMLLSYDNIRMVNIFVVFILLFISAHLVAKRVNIIVALCYLGCLLISHIEIFPYSMQFANSYIVMMGAVIYVCCDKLLTASLERQALFFISVGSFTNFVDFLTAPLITLGLPLCVLFSILNVRASITFRRNLGTIAVGVVSWGLGYALTWISKWVIAALLTGRSFTEIFLSSVMFRILGDDEYPLDRQAMYFANFSTMFPKIVMAILLLCIIALVLLSLRHSKWIKLGVAVAPVLLLVPAPYIWYFGFANHSQIHYWFTYRAQSVAVLAVLCYIAMMIDVDKIRFLKDRQSAKLPNLTS